MYYLAAHLGVDKLHLLLHTVDVEGTHWAQHISAGKVSLQEAVLVWGWDARHVLQGKCKAQNSFSMCHKDNE